MQGIRAVDKDQPGPFSTVEYYVEDGPYSVRPSSADTGACVCCFVDDGYDAMDEACSSVQ